MKPYRHTTAFVLCLICATLLFISCEKDESENITTPTPINQAPTIESVTATPSTVTKEDTVALACIATDAEDSTLSYLWYSNDGRFISDTTQSTTEWIAPDTVGSYFVSVRVSDGEKNAVGNVNIEVEPPEPIEQDFMLTDSVHITMIWIAEGSFSMGAEIGNTDEVPVHLVSIDVGFWMGKYEVTQQQWEAVTDDNPSTFVGEFRPVEKVSWDDINQDFLPQIDDKFRLPSESEWEYACRAGTDTRFYWGDDELLEDIGGYVVYSSNDLNGTSRIGSKMPNPWGLKDMCGNVYEWCADDYHADYENAPADGSPWIDDPRADNAVLRGGAWNSEASDCRSSNRSNRAVSARLIYYGFRLVREP